MKLYELESEADRERQDSVRPRVPFRIAAEKTTQLGLQLSKEQLGKVGMGKEAWAQVLFTKLVINHGEKS